MKFKIEYKKSLIEKSNAKLEHIQIIRTYKMIRID